MSDTKSFANFWYYNKWKIILPFVIALVIIFTTVYFNSSRIEPDLVIGYVTDGRTLPDKNEEDVNKQVSEFIKDINNDSKRKLKFMPLIGMKVDVEIVAPSFQVLLVNGSRLKNYIQGGVFQTLDKYVDKYKINLDKNLEVKDPKKNGSVCAIPVSKINYLLNVGFPADDYYLTILKPYKNESVDITKNENANTFLDFVLSN